MERKKRMITLPCDCGCCMLVIEKSVWEDGNVDYNISIQDSRYDHNYNTVWGRTERAFMALLGKPFYFNGLVLDGEETFRRLIKDMKDLEGFKYIEDCSPAAG